MTNTDDYEKRFNNYYNKYSSKELREMLDLYEQYSLTDPLTCLIRSVLKDKSREEKLNLLGI